MSTELRSALVLALAVLCFAPPGRAQEGGEQAAPAEESPDVEGSKDHPLIPRYPKSSIMNYTHNEFQEHSLIVGFDKDEEDLPEEGKAKNRRVELVKM